MRRFTHGNTDGMLHRGAPVNPTATGREEWVRTHTKAKPSPQQCYVHFIFKHVYLTFILSLSRKGYCFDNIYLY